MGWKAVGPTDEVLVPPRVQCVSTKVHQSPEAAMPCEPARKVCRLHDQASALLQPQGRCLGAKAAGARGGSWLLVHCCLLKVGRLRGRLMHCCLLEVGCGCVGSAHWAHSRFAKGE